MDMTSPCLLINIWMTSSVGPDGEEAGEEIEASNYTEAAPHTRARCGEDLSHPPASRQSPSTGMMNMENIVDVVVLLQIH